jgi:hypothetical protein
MGATLIHQTNAINMSLVLNLATNLYLFCFETRFIERTLPVRMTARWDRHQDSSTEDPRSITWEDGTSATLDDFRSHSSHTSRFVIGPQAKKEVHIYPDIVADVYFDRYAKSWAIRGEGVTACALDVCDPLATDHDIIAALATLPMFYRVKINRP